jgi:hypothetical protein
MVKVISIHFQYGRINMGKTHDAHKERSHESMRRLSVVARNTTREATASSLDIA